MSNLYLLVLAAALMMVVGPRMSEAQLRMAVASPALVKAVPVDRVVAEPVFLDGMTGRKIDASSIAEAQGATETDSEDAVRSMVTTEETRARVSRRPVSCSIRHYKQRVVRNGCTGVITSHYCYGYCWSSSYMFSQWGSGNKHEYQFCKCCRSNFKGAVSQYFKFTCRNGQVWYYPYTVVKSCACQNCGSWPTVAGPY